MDAKSKKLQKTVDYLKKKERVLFITTSNRWDKSQESPKSTQLAHHIAELVGQEKVTIIDATKLVIHPCEGNVSGINGNGCGLKQALLKDEQKNPSGLHRCWASLNNSDDELWKISKEMFECDAVVFFVSARWGQTNSYYQKVIERLTWIENRHTTLGEKNIVKDIEAGFVLVGHNWRVQEIIQVEKSVLEFFGFKTPKELFFGYQYTKNAEDESEKSYKETVSLFQKIYGFKLNKTSLHEIRMAVKRIIFGK